MSKNNSPSFEMETSDSIHDKPLDNSLANEISSYKFENDSLKISKNRNSFERDTFDSEVDSSPESLSNPQGIMENVQLFNKFTGNAMKHDLDFEIKVENVEESLDTSDSNKCFMNKQSVLEKACNNVNNNNNLKMKNPALPIKQENLAQSVLDKTRDSVDLNESLNLPGSNFSSKSYDNKKTVSSVDECIDIGRRSENHNHNVVDKRENVSMVTSRENVSMVTSKIEKKRRIDDILDKKFGNESKKIKLPSQIIASVKNSIAINNKKNKQFFDTEKTTGQKDDVYSFEDEVISNESAKFSYQSFDKNVLHKRKSSAKFLSTKRSTHDLNEAHHLRDSKDFSKVSVNDKEVQDEFKTSLIEPKTSLIEPPEATKEEVPLLNIGADITDMVSSSEKGKMPENFRKDKALFKFEQTEVSDNSVRTLKIDMDSASRQNGSPCNIRCISEDSSRHFCNQSSSNKSSKGKSLSADVSSKPPNSGLQKMVSENILSTVNLEKTFPESAHGYSRASENGLKENITNIFDQEKKICLNEKLIEKINFPIEKKEAEKKVVKNIESKTDCIKSIKNVNGMQKFPFEMLLGPPEVCSVNKNVNGVVDRNDNRRQNVDRYSGMSFLRPPFNGNSVIDKRLEAIRKVSMWIGDCMDSAARNSDSPEDLSVDKTVPKAQGQITGNCASLSETLRTSSVKTKCASINVKCASSNALVKSEHTETSKPTCKVDSKSKQPLNVNQDCVNAKVNVKCQQNVKEIQQNVKEICKLNGFNVQDNSCLETVNSKIRTSDDKDSVEKGAKHPMGKVTAGERVKKLSGFSTLNGISKNIPSHGALDDQFDTDSKEQCSSSFDQSLFNINTEHPCLDPSKPSENSNLKKNMKVMQFEIKPGNSTDTRYGNLQGLKTHLEVNGIKNSVFGKDVKRMRMSSIHNEQIKGFESACIDLSVDNLDEQISDKSSGNKFVAKTVVDSYGAEVWGLGNDVYNANSDIVDVNDVKTVTDDVACVDESTSQVYCLINVKNVPDDVKCKHVNNIDNVAKGNSLVNVSEISELLEAPGTYIECDNSGLEKGKETKSNKIDVKLDVDKLEGGNNGVRDLTVKTVNFGDSSSTFDFTPEHFNFTYPSVVIDTNEETQSEALDLHVDEHLKDYRLSSASTFVKCESNQDSDLLYTNITVSLSQHNNVQSRAVSTKVNKEKPKTVESQNANGYVKSKYAGQNLVHNEASPHIPVVKQDMINGFSGHDWSADDLADLGLDNSEEEHSLENINPVSLIDCPVSIANSLISVNHDPVSASSSLVSSSRISFSAGSDTFSNYPVSVKSNLVPNDERNLVPGVCDSENQFPGIIDNKGNQIPKSTDNSGNQFPNMENSSVKQFPGSTDNAENGNQFLRVPENDQFPLDDLPQLIGESEDYQWNETLKSFIMQNLDNEPKEENGAKEAAADVELLLEQKLAEQYLNRNIESLKRKHSVDL